MDNQPYLELIQSEIIEFCKSNTLLNFEELSKYFKKDRRIFVGGVGRSSMAARGFVNRLVHLGYSAHLIGEISTPLARKDDVVLLISNSGNTNSLYTIGERAKKDGAKILSITSNKDSKIFQISEDSLVLKDVDKSNQPMGSLFEQAALLVTDAFILFLMNLNLETSESMRKRHSNLE
ncbi:SIS domain-containing protein [uncultured Anaerococcus sp.]|uniref:SIS domain-containing protein n=1 Tax=uncultured Anaerococcus sp. TaxID=293428 RepID=UPI002889EE51|nr:SIS domain-containing protein [uncultured Anaerococcus sp.]